MLFNKHIFTLKSRDINPTGAEIMGVLSPARWISNNAFVLIICLIFSSSRSNSKLLFLYIFFLIWGIGKPLIMVVQAGYLLESLLLEFLMWDAVSLLVLSLKELQCGGSNSPIQWRKMRQAEVDSIYIKMARLTESQCRLCSLETAGFPQWQGLNRAEGKLRIGWGGTSESHRNS